MKRRIFLKVILKWGGGFITGILILSYFLAFLVGGKRKEKRNFFLGTEKDFKDGVSILHIGERKIAVIKKEGKLTALSTTCPHLGCSVIYREIENIFLCPCHRGAFNLKGDVIKGPPREGLKKYNLILKDGLIFLEAE